MVGRITPEGDDDEIGQLGAMAFAATGQALYVASPLGLSVLGRDSNTGTLTNSQFLAGDLTGAALTWDGDNARLLVFKDCEAKAYEAVDDTYVRLRDAAELTVSGASPCIDGRVFTEGAFVYGVGEGQDIRVYAVEEGDALRHVQTFELPSVRDAVLANAGGHLYAVEDYTLHVLERDEHTGQVAALARTSLADQVFSLAVSHDDVQVYTFGRIPAFVHDLQDPADPRLVGYLTPPTRFLRNLNCSLSMARNERSAAGRVLLERRIGRAMGIVDQRVSAPRTSYRVGKRTATVRCCPISIRPGVLRPARRDATPTSVPTFTAS